MSRYRIMDKNARKITVMCASTQEIDKYEDLAMEFFERILGLDYNCCLLTDKSSLLHISGSSEYGGVDQNIVNRIIKVYGVDISDIDDANFVEIFSRIAGVM